MNETPHDRLRFQAAFVLCAGAALLPLWLGQYPPFVDYPQHLAQLDLWQKMGDSAWHWREHFQVDLFTPYLIVYCLAQALSTLFSDDTSVRCLLSVYVVATPAVTALLLHRLDQSIWTSLLVFPAVYGFSMTIGMLNYTFSVPLGILAVAVAIRRTDRIPQWLLLAPLLLVLSFSHVLAWALTSAFCAVLLVRLWPDWRTLATSALALAIPVPLVLSWMYLTHGNDPVSVQENIWDHSPFLRLGLLPSLLVGEMAPQLAQHITSSFYGLAVIFAPFAIGQKFDLRSPAVAPLLVAVSVYLFLPSTLWGVWGVAERFTLFVMPLWLACNKRDGPMLRFSPLLLLAIVLPWLGYLAADSHRFDQRAREFEEIVERMEPRRWALGVTDDIWLGEHRGPTLAHLGCWYQMRSDGLWEPSFAHYFTEVVQFVDVPAAFMRQQSKSRGDRSYDYYVVSGFAKGEAWADAATLSNLRMVHDTGTWQLWEPIARAADACEATATSAAP